MTVFFLYSELIHCKDFRALILLFELKNIFTPKNGKAEMAFVCLEIGIAHVQNWILFFFRKKTNAEIIF